MSDIDVLANNIFGYIPGFVFIFRILNKEWYGMIAGPENTIEYMNFLVASNKPICFRHKPERALKIWLFLRSIKHTFTPITTRQMLSLIVTHIKHTMIYCILRSLLYRSVKIFISLFHPK